MKVLYLTNIHNPYRDEFFEQLGQQCDLTVTFEAHDDDARDASWFNGAQEHSYCEVFLPTGTAAGFKGLRGIIAEGWDVVVVGCYNSKVQMLAIEHMRRRKIRYAVNLDGPLFYSKSSIKGAVRKHVLRNADLYLVAGKTSVGSVRREVGATDGKIVPYSFSSLTEAQLSARAALCEQRDENLILGVGQFLPYKDIDVLLDAFAGMHNEDLRLRLIGAGKRNAELEKAIAERGLADRAEAIAFMPPEELALEYARAGLFVLPSRQECWGLVVNEAAACGCPIVSTWGAGAAVEFLANSRPQLLAEPCSTDSLALTMGSFLARPREEKQSYAAWLQSKATAYTVESSVKEHLAAFDGVIR